MSATVNIHTKTFTATARLFGENSERGQFATIDLDDGSLDVRIFLGTPALCDDLIKAACAAKDMLAAAGHAATMTDPLAPLLPDRGRYDAKSVAEVDEGVAPAADLYRGATAIRLPDVMAQAYVNTGLHADALAAEKYLARDVLQAEVDAAVQARKNGLA